MYIYASEIEPYDVTNAASIIGLNSKTCLSVCPTDVGNAIDLPWAPKDLFLDVPRDGYLLPPVSCHCHKRGA